MRLNRFWMAVKAALPLAALFFAAEMARAQVSTTLPEVTVTATAPVQDGETVPVKEKYQLPNSAHGIASDKIDGTVNAVDAEDVVKYFPSLFVRKRNNGDTQAVLATRTSGVNASARSLVYADDVMLSALIGNNNTNAAPRWGLVSPEEIARVDFLYGPFAAQYPGNSAGGVLLITTKMPDKTVASVKQTEAFQTFSLYGTHDTYETDQTNVLLGGRQGDVSWLVTDNFQNSYSQPLAFVTNGSIPAGTSGAYQALNKTGAAADVVGAGGLLHTRMNDVSGKVAWDIAPALKLTYQLDFWSNDTQSSVQTYLRNGAGNPTFGPTAIKAFASNTYSLDENHLVNSVSLKTDTKDDWDWDLSASNYYYLDDIQRNPTNPVANTTAFTSDGTITRMDGTNWTNGDAKAIYRPDGPGGAHELSFGFHGDRYELENPTYATPTWNAGSGTGAARSADNEGATMTEALWAQDAWRFAPKFKLTLGGRLEFWEAMDGFNLSGAGSIHQKEIEDARFSPKASLGWIPSDDWEVTGSFGQAYRFPTVTELYQTVTTGPVLSNPNPNLRPENVLTEEVDIVRKFKDGQVRLSGFNENVYDALVSQTNFAGGGVPVSYVTNVESERNTGAELAAEKDSVIHGVDVFASVTYVHSAILGDPSFASAAGTTAVGKRVPYIPDWRSTFGVTWRPIGRLSLTAAGRYSGKMYSTLDNTDAVSGVFGSFDSYFVADFRARYQVDDRISVDAGIDNVNDEKYFLYHPFPQRTYTTQVKIAF